MGCDLEDDRSSEMDESSLTLSEIPGFIGQTPLYTLEFSGFHNSGGYYILKHARNPVVVELSVWRRSESTVGIITCLLLTKGGKEALWDGQHCHTYVS